MSLDAELEVGTESPPVIWFDQMTGYLRWKIVGPDIRNPYQVPPPLNVMIRMARQSDFLARYIQVKCLADGFQVMTLINPMNPIIQTDHPCISQLSRDEIIDYLERSGVAEVIAKEVDRIQAEIQEELVNRQRQEAADDLRSPSRKLIPSKKKDKPGRADSGYRIIRK